MACCLMDTTKLHKPILMPSVRTCKTNQSEILMNIQSRYSIFLRQPFQLGHSDPLKYMTSGILHTISLECRVILKYHMGILSEFCEDVDIENYCIYHQKGSYWLYMMLMHKQTGSCGIWVESSRGTGGMSITELTISPKNVKIYDTLPNNINTLS